MIRRDPPQSVRYERDPFWERTREFRDLVQTMVDDPGAKLPSSLSDGQRVAVEAEASSRRWGGFSRGDYRAALERAMDETRLRISAPVSDAPTEDLIAAWRQPEARELWQRIIADAAPNQKSAPGLHAALGVMLAVGGMRATPHILHGYNFLRNNGSLFALVSELARSCQGVGKCDPVPRSYEQITRYLPRLAEGLPAEVHVALAQIASTFANWGLPVGRHLAVDGSLVPAWAQQRGAFVDGKFNQALEDRLNRRTPEARFVVHGRVYDQATVEQSKRPDGAAEQTRGVTRRVRGYLLTCVVDLATGLTLAFDLSAATAKEPEILREVLLPRLFDLSPHLEVSAIVGDAGYDHDRPHGHLQTNYGIPLVAIRKSHALMSRGKVFREVEHPSVKGLRGDGVAVCRAHGLELEYKKLDAPPRNRLRLRPGDPTDPRAFRSRFFCPAGCGMVSIATQRAWSNLPYFPHNPHGRPNLFALRRALLLRRNQVEASFSALQVGYKQCLDGAARVRVADRGANEALLAIAIVTRALLALAAEREHRGEVV
jgi:hypothetical protein